MRQQRFYFSFALFPITCALVAGPSARALGVRLVSTECTGTFVEQRNAPSVTVKPGEGKLILKLEPVAEHGAGPNFEGWLVDYEFQHPQQDQDRKSSVMMFWDKNRFAEPLVKGYQSDYSYFEAYYTPPMRVKSEFDAQANQLRLDYTSIGGLVRNYAQITPTADKKGVVEFSFQVVALGEKSVDVTCRSSNGQ